MPYGLDAALLNSKQAHKHQSHISVIWRVPVWPSQLPWQYCVLPQQVVPLLMFTPSVALIPGLDFGRPREGQGKGYGTETKSMKSYNKGIQTENKCG
jgi:hypothetical protein